MSFLFFLDGEFFLGRRFQGCLGRYSRASSPSSTGLLGEASLDVVLGGLIRYGHQFISEQSTEGPNMMSLRSSV